MSEGTFIVILILLVAFHSCVNSEIDRQRFAELEKQIQKLEAKE